MMMDDIISLYNEMTSSILVVEENENDAEALSNVKASFEKIFEIIKMFLITKKERYYGYFLMDMSLQVDFYRNFPAGVTMDTWPFSLIVNPLLLGKYSIKGMVFIICHEIEHIVLEHPAIDKKENPEKDPAKSYLLNLATDASINDRLSFDVGQNGLQIMSMPDDAITSESLGEAFDKHFLKMQDYLYYYSRFPKTLQVSSDSEEILEDSQTDEKIQLLQPQMPSIVTAKNRRDGCVLPVWSHDDSSEMNRSRLRAFAETVIASIPEQNRENLPEHQKITLRKLLEKPRVSWKTLLRKYIGSVPTSVRKTKTRLNRMQPERYDLSGSVPERTIKLIVAIDTSASVSDKDLEMIFTEIFAILKTTKFELTVIECDAAIQRVYTAKTMNDIHLHVHGRGGTSFRPVIDLINKDRRYKGHLLIYFTDGFADRTINKPRTFRILWMITGVAENLSLSKPYGAVIGMQLNRV